MSARRTTLPRDAACGLAVFLWLAMLAWARPLMLPDEGRYVGVAWEMLRSHEWLTPTLNGLPYFHKPPLFYWITASSLSLFGPHELPARLASLLGAWCGAMALFILVRKWSSPRMANTSLVVLLCQPLFYVGAQFANLDMLVAGLITATVCLLADAALSIEKHEPFMKALAGAYACAALGVLAKGLIGFVLPALVIGLWLVCRRQWRTLWALLWWPGAVIFVLLAAPWFLVMQHRFPAFLDYFFVVQHFQRFSGSGFNNAQPLWFYPAVLALLTAPWLPWLRPLLARPQHVQIAPVSLCGLWLAWIIVVVAFFSMPRSKLIGYVLPAVPPLAALIAEGIAAWQARAGQRPAPWRLAGSMAVSLLTIVAAISWLAIHPAKSTKLLADDLRHARAPGQRVVMLEDYYFDVPFYAGLKEPVAIADEWEGEGEGAQRDNWRKELADAGRFAPDMARAVLQPAPRLVRYLCQQRHPVLIMGSVSSAARWGLPASSSVIAQRGETALWHWQPPMRGTSPLADCSGKPTDG